MECFSVPEPDDWSSPKPTPSRAPEREQPRDYRRLAADERWCWQCNAGGYVVPANKINPKGGSPSLIKCGVCNGEGRIPVEPPPSKANFAFDFAKPPPAASVRADEIVVRREDALAASLALYRAYEASYSPAEQSWLLHAHERITAALTTAPEPSGTSQDGEGT